jgi:hypothetical protein
MMDKEEMKHWMELLAEAGIMKQENLEPLMQEADEPVAITVASIHTAKRRIGRK